MPCATKLDAFLQFNDAEILQNKGKVTAAIAKAFADFSTYADMNLWRQLESVAKNRWVGAYRQEHGLTVIPTISWGTPRSFEFCFDGVEQNATVAVSTLGCKRSKLQFMRGYNAMLNKLNPKSIICFGEPLPEMEGNIIDVDYWTSRKVAR